MIKSLLASLVLICVAAGQGAAAQTLREAVEGAWTLNPRIQTLEAQRKEFVARREAAAALFPAPPAITLGYTTDQLVQNKLQRTADVELSTPLWLPGEGTATERLAEADLVRIDAELTLARLAVAGAVRDAVYKYALAAADAELAERRVENARALETDVTRRERAGEVAALEGDLARSELLAAQANARERQAQMATARIALLSLTGLKAPPEAFEEPLETESDISRHPRLQAGKRIIDVAEAKLRLVNIATRDSPEIGVSASRNRDTFGTQYDTTVGLRLRVPFATDARNAPRQAAAEAELAAAQAEYASAEREIRVETAAAQQALAASEAAAPLVEQRLQSIRASAARLQKSYNAGEIGLIEVLRAQVAVFEAELSQVQNRLAVAQARARVNQALGLIP